MVRVCPAASPTVRRGPRTFLLLGLIGGMAGELHIAGQAMAAGVLLVAAGSLVVAAYLLLGLTDVDALTFSIAKLGSSTAADLAGKALSVGALANTLFKLAAVVVLGRGTFALHAGASLLAMALAAAVPIVFW